MTQKSGRRYWSFYWPLALTGLVSLIGNQIQNATLARYPNATAEIATFALAAGVFHLFDAALIFIPQMTVVLGKSPTGSRVCRRFVLLVSAILTVPVILTALPPVGAPILRVAFGIEGETLAAVMLYVTLLSPNIVLAGLRNYYVGLVIQAERTRLITLFNVLYLGVVLAVLLFGYHAGWRAVITLAAAQGVASVVHLAALYAAAQRLGRLPLRDDGSRIGYAEVFAFFWPVALTSVMFSLSRPIIYSFLGRLDDPQPVIAAMRVGFDFAMIFHNLLNQFRHVFVTFGAEDLAGVRRFMTAVTGVVVGGMVAVVATPVSTFILGQLIGVGAEVLTMTRQVLLVMCLLPVVVAFRNYFHGVAMVRRHTGPMGAGAVGRNAATYLVSLGLFSMGWLDHATAAATLVAGFLAESLVVVFGTRKVRRRR